MILLINNSIVSHPVGLAHRQNFEYVDACSHNRVGSYGVNIMISIISVVTGHGICWGFHYLYSQKSMTWFIVCHIVGDFLGGPPLLGSVNFSKASFRYHQYNIILSLYTIDLHY